jgi:hypothetical protein
LNAFERTIAAIDARDDETTYFAGRLALYRSLVSAINQLSLESLHIWPDGQQTVPSTELMLLGKRDTQVN